MGDSAGVPALAENDEEPFLDAAWTEAIEATELLRTVLSDLGLADCFPRLRGDVNVYGRPMVTVGRIEPGAARRLAAVLSRAVPGRETPPRFGGGAAEGAKDLPPPVVPMFTPMFAPIPSPAPAPLSAPAPMPTPMPAPRTYGGPGSASASDDLQASALRLMRLYGGPAAPAQAADVRDVTAPESWVPMLAACAVPTPGGELPLAEVTRMPLRADGGTLDGMRGGGGHRLPA